MEKFEGKVCAFTGHREIEREKAIKTFEFIKLYLEKLIVEEGYTIFKAGGAIGFDAICAESVLRLKEKYPHIELHLYIPHLRQSATFTEKQKRVYMKHINAADKRFIISEKYTRGCMHTRNRALVDGSDLLIAYLTQNKGGTFYTVDYARKKGVETVNVA